MRAIETHYAGCRFRSRLEARWAVFFDTLGVEWQYELEGFETDAGPYLPDFWLPEFHKWVEVKPDGRPLTQSERDRMGSFGHDRHLHEQGFLLLTGLQKPHGLLSCQQFVALKGDGNISHPDLGIVEGGQAADYMSADFAFAMGWLHCTWMPAPPAETRRALVAARSARFEHGESG